MQRKAGSTSQSVSFAAWTTLTGAPVTVTSATTGLSLWYRRGVTGAKTAITPVNLALITSAYSSGGIKVIEGAEHRLDLPDAALAAGELYLEWGGTATGITIDGGSMDLIGQENSAPALALVDSLLTIPATLKAINSTSIAGSGTQVAASFLAQHNVVTPVFTNASVNQTGDSFNRIGAAGAGLTALGDTRLANLDAAVSTRSTYAGGDTSGTTTLLARVPQVIPMAQVGGVGSYYVEAVRHDGALIHEAGAAVAKSPATLAAADVSGNLPADVQTVRQRTAQDVGAGNTAYFGTVAFPSSWPENWSWSTLTQADIRTAVGLASANLDTQLTAINGYVDVLPASWVTVPTAAQNADAVWDEQLTGATHNIATSAGRRLRQLAAQIVIDGTAAGSTSNTIVLDSDASTVDGAYDPSLIFISGGTGEGQCRLILEYDGGTKTAVVDRNWKVNPVSGNSTYVIMGDAGREHVNEGLAQAGGTSTITLNPLASSSDNCYIAQRVFIRSGTGEDQSRRVIAYNGTTKVATVSRPWDTVPDTTSAYVMLPTGAINDNDLSTAILDEPLDQHAIAGSVGAAVELLNTSVAIQETLLEVQDAVDALEPPPRGSYSQVFTVTAAALPVQGVTCQILDAADDSLIDIGTTNSSGQVTLRCDAGDVKFAAYKYGYTSYTSATTTVSGAASRPVAITRIAITPSTDPAKVTGWIQLFDHDTASVSGGTLYVRQAEVYGKIAADAAKVTLTADANGIASLPLFIGEYYQHSYDGTNWSKAFEALDDGGDAVGTFQMPGILKKA